MLRFSKKEDYAVILINKLAKEYEKRLVPLSEVAREYKISLLFLRNLALELRSAGIIKATEGKKGGYFLQRDPKQLKIGEVLSLFSKKPMLECCLAGKGKSTCPKEEFCDPGFVWRRMNREFLDKIYNLTILEFINYKRNTL